MWSGDGKGRGNIRQWHGCDGMEKGEKVEKIRFWKEKAISSEIVTVNNDKIRIEYWLLFTVAQNRQYWNRPLSCSRNNCLESCRQVKYRNCSLLLYSVTYQNCVSCSTWIKAVGFTRTFEKMDGNFYCLVSVLNILHPLPLLCNLIKGHSAHIAVSRTFLTFLQKYSLQVVVVFDSCNGAK